MALVTLAMAVGSAAAVPASAATWRSHLREAAAYAAPRAGVVSFGVRTRHGLRGLGVERTVPSASVVKPMLLVPYLRRPGARDRALRAAERGRLGPMIRRSDNSAASQVCNVVGTGGLARLARRAGMRRFQATRPWGLSRIDVADQTRFFLGIDRLVPRRHRRYTLRLLGSIVPSQRWGSLACARAAGRSTSRAGGARAQARRTTRWPSSGVAGGACPWRS